MTAERIGLLKQQKGITDASLLAMNKLTLPFEHGDLDDRDDVCSTLVARMQAYSMRALNLGPIKLACIQEEIFLKVG